MLKIPLHIYFYGVKSLYKWDMPRDDTAITILADSDIATELFDNATNDGIEFKRTHFRGNKGFYSVDDKLAALDVKAGFDTNAHETVHHHHRESNNPRKRKYLKDKILGLLLHEAEAYAIQGLVVLEAYKKSYADPLKKQRIDNGIASICAIYPEFRDELDKEHDDDSKRALANTIFRAYLLTDNPRFKGHLQNYTKWKTLFPLSAQVAFSSAITAGLFYAGEKLITSYLDMGLKGYLGIAAVFTIANISNLSEKRKRSKFKEVFDTTAIGDIPTIEGNYLDDIRALKKGDPLFDRTIQRISDHVDSKLLNFEKGVGKALMSALPR